MSSTRPAPPDTTVEDNLTKWNPGTDTMDTTTPYEAPRPLPERQFPQMVPAPPRPVTKGGGAYAQNVRPRRCLAFGWSAFNPGRIRSVGDGFRWFAIWYETQSFQRDVTICTHWQSQAHHPRPHGQSDNQHLHSSLWALGSRHHPREPRRPGGVAFCLPESGLHLPGPRREAVHGGAMGSLP